MENFIWNELSKESKDYIIETNKKYLKRLNEIYDRDSIEYYETCAKVSELENMFGYDNINPKPQIKTWVDVVEYYNEHDYDIYRDITQLNTVVLNDIKFKNKLIAEYKIKKIIEHGYYGQLCTIDDVSNTGVFNFVYKIVRNSNLDTQGRTIDIEYSDKYFNFLSFRTKKDADEFWNNNEDLICDYFMI